MKSIDELKKKYMMGLSAESEFSTEIEMTYEEAKIVHRVLNELNSKNDESWSGCCWIDFEE